MTQSEKHYSGPNSEAFWARVNAVGGDALYLMGCALQDVEVRMWQALIHAEEVASRPGEPKEAEGEAPPETGHTAVPTTWRATGRSSRFTPRAGGRCSAPEGRAGTDGAVP